MAEKGTIRMKLPAPSANSEQVQQFLNQVLLLIGTEPEIADGICASWEGNGERLRATTKELLTELPDGAGATSYAISGVVQSLVSMEAEKERRSRDDMTPENTVVTKIPKNHKKSVSEGYNYLELSNWISHITFILWLHIILYQTNLCIRDVELSHIPEAWKNYANAWIKFMTYMPIYVTGGDVIKRVIRWTPKVVLVGTISWWLLQRAPDYSR